MSGNAADRLSRYIAANRSCRCGQGEGIFQDVSYSPGYALRVLCKTRRWWLRPAVSYRSPGPSGLLPAEYRHDSHSAAGDICLARGRFSPTAARLFMIVGRWWRYSPLLTHDHESHTYGGYKRMPVPSSPPRAWYANMTKFTSVCRLCGYVGQAHRGAYPAIGAAGVLHNRINLYSMKILFTLSPSGRHDCPIPHHSRHGNEDLFLDSR